MTSRDGSPRHFGAAPPNLSRATPRRVPGTQTRARPAGRARAGGESCYFGSSTLSTTWITPFDWTTSGIVTWAMPPDSSLSMIMLPLLVAVSVPPETSVSVALPPPASIAFEIAALSILPATTWYVSTLVSAGLFSGLSSVSTVPAGSAANASLVGANTVNGPGPFSVATRPAALTAATSVVWSFELTALSMMSLDAYIGAPPTVTCAKAETAERAETDITATTTTAESLNDFMTVFPWVG